MQQEQLPPVPVEAPPARHRLKRLILLGVVPLCALLGGSVVYLKGGGEVETENAYVSADKVPVSAEVAGTVREVLVRENQSVAAGQPLFRLDAQEFRIALLQAEARQAQVRSDFAALKAAYRTKEAEIAVARTRQEFAQRDRERLSNLLARHFISPARFDEASEAVDLAARQIVALEEDLRRIAENLGGSPDTPLEQHPAWLAAQASLQQARLDLERTEVRAAQAGTVSRLPKPGQYLSAGNTALALVVDGNLWVEANFTEKELAHVHPGQAVEIRVDTYPDQRWRGVVDSLSPATGAEFSVIPAQNATGNWVKVAQRVPVRIRIESDPQQPALRAGLSALATVHTGQRRSLLGLTL